MCSRVAASIAYATGSWPHESPHFTNTKGRFRRCADKNLLGHSMVVFSYQEYLERAIELGLSLKWEWVPLSSHLCPVPLLDSFKRNGLHSSPYFPNKEMPTHIYIPKGYASDLRKQLFLNREIMPLFDTARWTRHLERGIELAYSKWRIKWAQWQAGARGGKRETRCIHVESI